MSDKERDMLTGDTPRTDALVATFPSVANLDDLSDSFNALLDFASTLERDLARLTAAIERAYQMLEANGVPRKRAKSVANGIDVLATRFRKAEVAQENEALRKTVENLQRVANLQHDLSVLPPGLDKVELHDWPIKCREHCVTFPDCMCGNAKEGS